MTLPLKPVFAESFNGYFEYDEKSKAQHKGPGGGNLKPDVIVRDGTLLPRVPQCLAQQSLRICISMSHTW